MKSSEGEYLSSHSSISSFFGSSLSSGCSSSHFEHGVLLYFLLDGLYKLQLRKLEQLYGLLQLRRQHELLRELLCLFKFQH